MRSIVEFDKNAKSYRKYRVIQDLVALRLIEKIRPYGYQNILDIGAGDGALYEKIDWEIARYYALDGSKNMLALHPEHRVTKILCNFNEACFAQSLQLPSDIILSASALQWAEDIESIFKQLSSRPFALALFSANTFKSLHELVDITSPILTPEEIYCAKEMLPNVQVETKRYELNFATPQELFSYIKRSGVSGGDKKLSIAQTRHLLKNYTQNFLEFEVIFLYNI